MADIDLGFPEERNREWLTNRYFPSKVGGRPAWLELDNLPAKEKLECGKCKAQQSFLCQIYASYDDEHNFHRTIYVFTCRSVVCQEVNSAKNFTVLRSQLPRKNDFYSEEAPLEDGDPVPSIAPKSKLCLACGCLGPMCCARCKKANYCSVQHQRVHWPHHKTLCTADSTLEEIVNQSAGVVLSGIRFPEWEILIEPNDEEEAAGAAKSNAKDDEASEQERLSAYEKLVAEGKAGELKDIPDSELDKYASSSDGVDDKEFSKFRKEVSKDPEQILRYKRNGQPLWIAPLNECIKSQLEIPNCGVCGGPRQFEFQIMPQMLLLLDDEQPDWGVLAVYTCASSCKLPAGVGYVDEYIVKQDILVNKI